MKRSIDFVDNQNLFFQNWSKIVAFSLIILMTLICNKSFSQNDSIFTEKNLLYIEAAGIGGYGSFNYERILFSKHLSAIGIRLGLGTYHLMDYTDSFNPDIISSLSVNGYYGNNHKIIFGIGKSYSSIVQADVVYYKKRRASDFHSHFSVGYHYQKNTSGMIFRFAYTPILEQNSNIRNWIGVSLGYSF